jgi:hypothetical protein
MKRSGCGYSSVIGQRLGQRDAWEPRRTGSGWVFLKMRRRIGREEAALAGEAEDDTGADRVDKFS